jgi:predicted dehydrogenase
MHDDEDQANDPYGLGHTPEAPDVEAPLLDYRPPRPKQYDPGIALIGCGGITEHHLQAYRTDGYRVVALCDLDRNLAENRRKQYYPEATVHDDFREVLRRDDVEVVDVATHPQHRTIIIETALRSGMHVLSQKPFVLDLDEGARLADLADEQGVRLAVNQNGRWAPHFSYLRQAIHSGLIGQVDGLHFGLHWDHGWVRGTEFEKIKHLLLYDFAIHWFDIACCFLGDRPIHKVYATTTRAATQRVKPPLLAQAMIECEGAQASITLDGNTPFGQQDTTCVVGSQGTLISQGVDLNRQQVTLDTAEGRARPELEGAWFSDGFRGTMGELLLAIEEDRCPQHNARDNLKSLALCFAAVASAERGQPLAPGAVRKIPKVTF